MQANDSINVNIPINIIRQANIKLLERKYLLQEIAIKDSIIDLNKNYINIQEEELNKYKYHLEDNYKNYIELNDKLNNYKTKVNYYRIGFGCVVVSISLFILLR